MSIAKIGTNHSAPATLRYVLKKEGARVIGGNLAPWVECDHLPAAEQHHLIATTAQKMQLSVHLNGRVKRPVYHISISFHPDEDLNDEQMNEFCEKHLSALIVTAERPALLKSVQASELRADVEAFRDHQLPQYSYVIVRHTDQSHPHAHIVCSRVNLATEKAIPTSHDHYRSQAILRDLEHQFGLSLLPNSWEVGQRSPSISQLQREETSGWSVQKRLQHLLEQAAQTSSTVPQYIQRLQTQGVEVRVRLTRTGKRKGISYGLDGVALSGNALGNRYSFSPTDPGLVKHLGLSYDPERDDDLIQQLCRNQSSSVEIEAAPLSLEEIAPSTPVPPTSPQLVPPSPSSVISATPLPSPSDPSPSAPPLSSVPSPQPDSPSWEAAQFIAKTAVHFMNLMKDKHPHRYDGKQYWMEWDEQALRIRVGRQGELEPFVQGVGNLATGQINLEIAQVEPGDLEPFAHIQQQMESLKHSKPDRSGPQR